MSVLSNGQFSMPRTTDHITGSMEAVENNSETFQSHEQHTFQSPVTPRIAVGPVIALLRALALKADAVSTPSDDTMGEMDAAVNAEAFAQSVRAGRRNALPDLGVADVDVGAHKLAEAFSNLDASGQAGSSGQTEGNPPAKE